MPRKKEAVVPPPPWEALVGVSVCPRDELWDPCPLEKADVVHIWMPGGLGPYPLLLWVSVWDEGGSGSLILTELFHPSEAVEREWEQKRPVLRFGNAHGAQGSEALGWSCHLLAFARLGGGTLKSKSPKSRRMSCREPSNCT